MLVAQLKNTERKNTAKALKYAGNVKPTNAYCNQITIG
jgi:hypothetical protein